MFHANLIYNSQWHRSVVVVAIITIVYTKLVTTTISICCLLSGFILREAATFVMHSSAYIAVHVFIMHIVLLIVLLCDVYLYIL